MAQGRLIITASNISIWVESVRRSKDMVCLLISGAGAGASFWSERLCNALAGKGFFIIKYDHRDFGYSGKIDFDKNPFDMMDLTRDAIAVLDAFNIKEAHVVGHSMGGFIAQMMAIYYPERVISIISASSSTGSPAVPLPPEKTWELFLENKPQNDFEKDLEGFLRVWKYLNGTAEFDEEMAVDYSRSLYERQDITGPLGASHVRAQEGMTDRSVLLQELEIPALVLHGEEDYLVDRYGGVQTAESIKNSKLVLIPEMGHMLFNQDVLKNFEDEIIHFISHLKI